MILHMQSLSDYVVMFVHIDPCYMCVRVCVCVCVCVCRGVVANMYTDSFGGRSWVGGGGGGGGGVPCMYVCMYIYIYIYSYT